MYQQFAVTIAVSVLISAFNALTLSPALSALLLRRGGRMPSRWERLRGFNRWFAPAPPTATSVLAAILIRNRLSMVLLLVVACSPASSHSARAVVPDEDQRYFPPRPAGAAPRAPGLSVSALNAEISTDTAIVTANC